MQIVWVKNFHEGKLLLVEICGKTFAVVSFMQHLIN